MKRSVVATFLCATLVASLLAGCGSKPASSTVDSSSKDTTVVEKAKDSSAASKGKYKIALSNSYMGNDWRQLMIKTAEVVAGKDPYKDKVDLTIVNCENTAEAQSASIDSLVEQGYDAILIDAASTTALNPSIDRAIEQGVVIASFDSVVDHKDAYIVQTDLTAQATGWANYLVKAIGGKGKIAVDTGLPGSTNGNVVYETAMKIFKDAGVEVVAEFAGKYADGVGQQEIASVLAANPDLDGIFTQVYGETIAASFKHAGRSLIPATAYDTNAGMLAAIDNKMNLAIANNAPGLGAIALSVAVKVLDGEKVDKVTNIMPGFFVTDKSVDIGYPTELIEENKNCFRKLPGALDWPALPSDFQPQVTVDEISNYKK